jgi:hypothetical protein
VFWSAPRKRKGLGVNQSQITERENKSDLVSKTVWPHCPQLFPQNNLSIVGGFMSEVTVRILKFNEIFTTRSKDIKSVAWFSMPCDLLIHPDFEGINGDEFKAFCWFVGIASKKKNDIVRMNIPHTTRLLNIKEASIHSMIKKLDGKQLDVVSGQDAAKTRPLQTGQTEHNKTDITDRHMSSGDDPTAQHLVVQIWNEYCDKLPKVKRLSSDRLKKCQKLIKDLSQTELTDVVIKMAKSDFCNGKNDNGWVATFDFFLKTENCLKTLEGKYDNRAGFAQTRASRVSENLKRLEEKYSVQEKDVTDDSGNGADSDGKIL